MISDIRNPWLRRPLCVIAAAVYLPIVMLAGALDAAEAAWVDVVAGWRGPRATVTFRD